MTKALIKPAMVHSTTSVALVYLLALNTLPLVLAAPGLVAKFPLEKREEPIHLPLKHRRSGQQQNIDYGVIADSIRARYGYPTVSSKLSRRASSTTVPIEDQQGDSSYIVTVQVGTP